MAITTWDPSAKGANITLSNGNLTCTSTTTASSTTHGTGGYIGSAALLLYFEATVNTVINSLNSWAIGISSSGSGLAQYLGQSSIGTGLYQNGKVLNNTLTITTIFTFAAGAVIGVAVNFTAQKVWFTINGTTWNNAAIGSQNPATNTGGITTTANNNPFIVSGTYQTVVPAFGTNSNTGNIGTANFGATAFSYAVPSGFTAWDPVVASQSARALVLA
jgi:hypothetical protein